MAKVKLRERVQKYVEACPKSRIFSLGHAYEAGWRARGRADRLTKAERADKAELVAALKKTRDELVSWCGADSGSEPVVEAADATLAKHGGT